MSRTRTPGDPRDGEHDGRSRADDVRHAEDDARRREGDPRHGGEDARDGGGEDPPAADLLSLLADEYARAVLRGVAGAGGAVTGVELVDRLDASRATVYRRLNALEEAGLVESRARYDPDGHHRRVYRATVESVTVEFGPGGVDVADVERDRRD